MPDIWRTIEALQPSRMDLTLTRMRSAVTALGLDDWANSRRWVLVAGTNGKGSTATALAEILRAHGRKVGLYTSPHLQHPRERIQFNGQPITDVEAAPLLKDVLALSNRLADPITYFEALTLCALLYYREVQADFGVLEVGLGGRLDATNVVTPTLSVITSVAFDHTQWLGDTLEAIAWEKGGVCRAGTPLVTALSPELTKSATANHPQAHPILRFSQHFSSNWSESTLHLDLGGLRLSAQPKLSAQYQDRNLACATMAAFCILGSDFSTSLAAQALQSAFIPGRFETIFRDGVHYILDGAHNPDGAGALFAAIAGSHARISAAVVAIRSEKDADGILSALLPLGVPFRFTTGRNRDSYWHPDVLADRSIELGAQATCHSSLAEALNLGRSTQDAQVVLVTGSLYMLGEARHLLLNP